MSSPKSAGSKSAASPRAATSPPRVGQESSLPAAGHLPLEADDQYPENDGDSFYSPVSEFLPLLWSVLMRCSLTLNDSRNVGRRQRDNLFVGEHLAVSSGKRPHISLFQSGR